MGSTPVAPTRDQRYELKGRWVGWRDGLVVNPLAENEFGIQHHIWEIKTTAPDHTPGFCGHLNSQVHVNTYVHTCLKIIKKNVKNK